MKDYRLQIIYCKMQKKMQYKLKNTKKYLKQIEKVHIDENGGI